MRMALRFPLGTVRKISAAPIAFSTNGLTACRSCWLLGTAEWTRASRAQNPSPEWTGSCASGWRPLLPGRPFRYSWTLPFLRVPITLLFVFPPSTFVLGLRITLQSGPWIKLRTSTSWRAPGCHSGALRSEVLRAGPFASSGSGARRTPSCPVFSTNCWIEWCCPSRPHSTSIASPSGTIFTKAGYVATSFESW
jgi:hypothetical protein